MTDLEREEANLAQLLRRILASASKEEIERNPVLKKIKEISDGIGIKRTAKQLVEKAEVSSVEPEETAAAIAKKAWLNLIESHRQDIEKNYALTANYIRGYYERRIMPYLAKPSYEPNGGDKLFRGMLLTIPELENVIKNGLDINLAHRPAGGGKPVLSFSSNTYEAVSGIFRPGREKREAVGVVVKIKQTSAHKLLDDPGLNPAKTIYHSYQSVPAEDIEGVYIWGSYGLENINELTKKIHTGTADDKWLKDLDNLFSR
jgi:hypothetical protein